MAHWRAWAARTAARILGRRHRPARPAGGRRQGREAQRPRQEGLERREVLNAAGSPPFAAIVGRIEAPARPAEVVFRLEPGRFVADRTMPMLLAMEAEPLPGSEADVRITHVVSLQGRNTYNIVPRRGPMATNVAVPNVRPTLYGVGVRGLDRSTGEFVLNVSLPGDADGDGVVDRTDMGRVRAAYGTTTGSRRYDSGADTNGDGRVGHFDYGLTHRNLGARASVVVPDPGIELPRPARS
jgi:hypothetical protein